ncbi:hypothetical protein Droror1_Dr00025370 [Drosera rotundifolia]
MISDQTKSFLSAQLLGPNRSPFVQPIPSSLTPSLRAAIIKFLSFLFNSRRGELPFLLNSTRAFAKLSA